MATETKMTCRICGTEGAQAGTADGRDTGHAYCEEHAERSALEGLAQRLEVAAGIESAGEPRATLDEQDAEAASAAAAHGSYAAALAEVRAALG